MRFVTALLIGVLSLTRADETPQAPFKFRVNTDIFKTAFGKRDQEIFKVLHDQPVKVADDSKLSDITVSVNPLSGEIKDFDFDLSVAQDDLGTSSNKLAYSGKGRFGYDEFTFSGPIAEVKYFYALDKKFNHDHNYEAHVWVEQPFRLIINEGDLKVEGASLTADLRTEIVTKITESLTKTKMELQDAKKERIGNFPMDLAVPFVTMMYATQWAENVKLSEKYMEMDFSMQHLGLLKKSQTKLLKNIMGEFYKETNEKGEELLAQININDNLFNGFSSAMTTIDKMFSMRDMFKFYPNAQPILQMLTTSTLGKVMPQFEEEYGSGKDIDLVLSPSHDLFLDGIPDSKMTGVYMDKNGNWKVQLNIPAQINLQTLPGMWEPIRNLYITMIMKLKIQQNSENPDDKKWVITPKAVEMSQMKVMKGDEEMQMEQMMIQSMVNIQLEQVKKMFKEIPGKVNTVLKRFPPELRCFGFEVSDLDVAYKKSQVQISAYQHAYDYEQSEADKEMCEQFHEELNSHPEKILETIQGGDNSPINKSIKAFTDAQKNEMMDDAFGGKDGGIKDDL